MLVLLGRHVVGSSDAGAGQVDLLVQDLRYPKISQLHPVVQNEYVGSLQVPVKNALVVHVKNCQSDLGRPVDHLLFFEFFSPVRVLLLHDELVEISPVAKLHDDVELLAFANALPVRYDVDVFELFEKFDFVVDVLDLFFVFVGQLNLFYHVILVLPQVGRQVGVPEGSESPMSYPCPIIFKILYSFIITTPETQRHPPQQPLPSSRQIQKNSKAIPTNSLLNFLAFLPLRRYY